MTRYDYTDYQKLLDSFDYKEDPFNPHTEIFEEHVRMLDTFDPIHNPPAAQDRKIYILTYIVPVLQEYCRDLQAVLEIDKQEDGITAGIVAPNIDIINEETDFKSILWYADSFTIRPEGERVRLELLFSTR